MSTQAGLETKSIRMKETTPIVCSGCGEDAGYWEPWLATYKGFGLCRDCAALMMSDFGREQINAIDFRKTCGVPGVNFAPRYYTLQERKFVILADFPATEHGCAEANAYLCTFDDARILTIRDGRVILIAADDEGVPIAPALMEEKLHE